METLRDDNRSVRQIPLSDLPGLTTLTRDYLQHQGRAAEFFNADFSDRSDWPKLAAEVLGAGHANRRQLVDILRAQNIRFGAGPETLAQLDRLADPQALAIVTGQQVGLFGGPLYTLYKALAVCKMAAELSADWNRPIVPVFYLVSEDHDIDEIRWAGYLDRNHAFQKVNYEPRTTVDRLPAAQVHLDDNILLLQQLLAEQLPFGEFQAEIMAALAEDYRPGETMATAFARWSLRLLRGQGIIILDASDDRLKQLMLPILRRELEENLSIPAMMVTNQQLSDAGYHAQLAMQPQRPHIFWLEQGRHSLERDGDGFRNLHNNIKLSLTDLLSHPERLSPKAALRPLAQDYLLPTLAYIGGPGEIAYWAQLKGVYAAFGRPMPAVMPRPGMTLLDARAEKWLQKYEITADAYLAEREIVEEKMRQAGMPAKLAAALATVRTPIEQRWQDVQTAIQQLDPTLSAPCEKTGTGILHAIEQLQAKVLRAVEQKEKSRADHLHALQESIWPGGQLQERQLNIVPLLCKQGWGLVQRLYETISWREPAHQIMVL